MRIVRADALDSIESYQFIEVDIPEPKEGELLIQVHSCGMGYVDALVALGRYQVRPPTPFTPGLEVGGVVKAVGGGVTNFSAGDRVMAHAFGGGLAEYVVAPETGVRRIPANMSFAQAAGFRTNYVTALHGLKDRAALKPGEKLLVLGAAGGVGSAAVQVGSIMGADVIAAASTDEKRSYAMEFGAHRVIDTEPEGWRERLKEACGGRGPDVVFDPVCGPLLELAFRSQNWNGRHLVVGFAGGQIPKLPVNLPLMKGAALVGVDVRQFFLFENDLAQSHVVQLLSWVEEGRLSPPVGRRFSLNAFAEAMEFALSGRGRAKTIIDVSNDEHVGLPQP